MNENENVVAHVSAEIADAFGMRDLPNTVVHDALLINGYDYENQCWVKDGFIQRCGHPAYMPCGCFGRKFAGAEYAKVVLS